MVVVLLYGGYFVFWLFCCFGCASGLHIDYHNWCVMCTLWAAGPRPHNFWRGCPRCMVRMGLSERNRIASGREGLWGTNGKGDSCSWASSTYVKSNSTRFTETPSCTTVSSSNMYHALLQNSREFRHTVHTLHILLAYSSCIYVCITGYVYSTGGSGHLERGEDRGCGG